MSALVLAARTANTRTDTETKVMLAIAMICTVGCILTGVDMMSTLNAAGDLWGI